MLSAVALERSSRSGLLSPWPRNLDVDVSPLVGADRNEPFKSDRKVMAAEFPWATRKVFVLSRRRRRSEMHLAQASGEDGDLLEELWFRWCMWCRRAWGWDGGSMELLLLPPAVQYFGRPVSGAPFNSASSITNTHSHPKASDALQYSLWTSVALVYWELLLLLLYPPSQGFIHNIVCQTKALHV
jgi:hypothetical protein